jgi:hypothetical protein
VGAFFSQSRKETPSVMETPIDIRSDSGAPEINDRRKSARHICDSQLYLAPMGTNRQNSWAASLRDLSTNGIGLTLSRRFELGAAFSIEWCPYNPAKLPSLMARVIRVFQRPDSTWWHGCELIGDVDSDELAAFLAASQAAAEVAARCPTDNDTSQVEDKEHIRGHAAWAVVVELRQTLTDARQPSNTPHKK